MRQPYNRCLHHCREDNIYPMNTELRWKVSYNRSQQGKDSCRSWISEDNTSLSNTD
jgi:hypothetical protein